MAVEPSGGQIGMVAQGAVVEVTVPPGVNPGSMIQVATPSGQTIAAIVPPGAGEGTTFQIHAPPVVTGTMATGTPPPGVQLLDARLNAGEYFKCCPCMCFPCCTFYCVYAAITPLNQDVFQFFILGLNVCFAWPQCGMGNLTRVPETNTFVDACNTVTLKSENQIDIGGVTFDKKKPTNNAQAGAGMQPGISAPPMQNMNRAAAS